jgi:hypothetical protein
VTILDIARSATSHALLVSPPRRHQAAVKGFYEAPAGFPAGTSAPGELIRSEPMDAYLIPGVRLRARAWRILYRSTGATGEPTIVSGALLIPGRREDRRPLRLVAHAIGTHGIGDSAAPSRLLARGLDWEAPLMAQLLARGWAVVVSDYQGLGTEGDHTYMVGRALGPNVLDSIRAARALAPHELPAEGPAAIVGYSEGGAAAAWAAQLQPSYAPDVPLVAVAAGAATTDLEAVVPDLGGTFFSFLIAYGGIGYSAAYPELDLDAHLTPKARGVIRELRDSNLLQAALHGPRFARATDLTSPNVLELPEWRRRLRENRLGTMAPAAPVLLHHARRDQIVSFTHSVELRDDWQRLGADVRLHVTRGGVDHVSGAVAGTPIAIDWLARRFERDRDHPAFDAPVVARNIGRPALRLAA